MSRGKAAATVDPARQQTDLASAWAVDVAYGSVAFLICHLLMQVGTSVSGEWRGREEE